MSDDDPSPGKYWQALEALVAGSHIVIDRPRGTAHPRYPEVIYPLDYGYLAGTRAADGDGIDIWIGSQPEQRVTAIIVTLDLVKRDSEIKLLLGCTAEERRTILAMHQRGAQSALLIPRPMDEAPGG